MTVLIAIKGSYSVWIGGDGRVCRGDQIVADDVVKWTEINKFWLGWSGHVRINTLLGLHRKDLLEIRDMVSLAEAVRALAIADGWTAESEVKGSSIDYQFDLLITDGKRVLRYDGDGSAILKTEIGDIVARGSGSEYALGAAHAVLADGGTSTNAVGAALAAAVRFNVGCGGDLFIQEIEP